MARNSRETNVMTQELQSVPQPLTHEEDPILSGTKIARMCGKTPQTVGNWIRDGLLKSIRLPSGLPGVRQSEVVKFLGASALKFKEPE